MRHASRVIISAIGVALALGVAIRTDAQAQNAPAPQLTRAPELTHFATAAYPASEQEQGRAATVVLQLTINKTGSVDDVKVAEGAGDAFDAAAVQAARQFVFRPAEIDHEPAAIRILYRYEFVLPPKTPPTAIFAGAVRAAGSGKPVAGVHVTLDSGQSAVTDPSGMFQLADVTPGAHAVTLESPELTAQRTEEVFEAGQRLEAGYEVALNTVAVATAAADDFEIEVAAPPLRKQVIATEISAGEARKVPGTQGDVLRVVENLPGVARAAVGSGQLVVWGAAPEDTRVYVDGVHIPRLYHNGGLRSVIASDWVESVELLPGGYGSAYGRGLGGLVGVTTSSIHGDAPHGAFALDLLDASASVRAPLSERLDVAIGVRRGHLQNVLGGVVDDKVEQYFPIPHYYDGQARVRYSLNGTDSIELAGLLSADSIARSVVDADPARSARETNETGFQRIYLHYRAQAGDGSTINVTPFLGWDQSALEYVTGNTQTQVSNHSTLGGLRASWRKPVEPWLQIEVGLDAEISSNALHRRGSIGAPPREGDLRVFGQFPPDQINTDAWQATLIGVAPYVEGDIALFDKHLHVYPGLRVDPNVTSVSRRVAGSSTAPAVGLSTEDFALEPRLSARYAFSDALSLRAAWGIYHQAPQPQDLSATFGNPALLSSRAMHWVLGANWEIVKGLSAELTGFYISSDDLVVRSPLSSPLNAQALVQQGEGRAFGQQILIREELAKGLFGWLSYSLVQSQRRLSSSDSYRPSDYDQTHVLTVVLSYELGAGFELGARVRYATGFPRSEVIDAFYDARRDLFQPIFGSQNGIRIPAFFQVDLRIAKHFDIAKTSLDVYLELQNASNQQNAEEIVYNSDYTKINYITGFPILPVAGLRWSF
jgi:TonB family protein